MPPQGGRKGRIKMKIAVIGYIFGGNKLTVSYDTVNKNFFVSEEYKEKDFGIRTAISYNVDSESEVRESLNRFKRSFANK